MRPGECLSTVSVILLLTLPACARGPATYTVEVIDGVEHVHNLASIWGETPGLALEHELTIGAGEVSDERYMLRTPSDALRDEEGTIYILDRWRPGVRVYDASGRHLLDIGKRGSGPGEFIEALAMDRSPSGEIFIVDPPGGKVSVMGSDGSFDRLLHPETFFFTLRLDPDSRLVTSRFDASRDPPTTGMILDGEGAIITRFGTGAAHEEENIRLMYNNAGLDVGPRGDIYQAFWYQNRIDVYTPDGVLRRRIDRPLPYGLESRIEYREYEADGETLVYPNPVLSRVSIGIGIDHQERIWSLTYLRQPDPDSEDRGAPYDPDLLRFEVFEPSGALLGYLPVPETCTGFRVSGDRILLADSVEKGCVHLYRIVGID